MGFLPIFRLCFRHRKQPEMLINTDSVKFKLAQILWATQALRLNNALVKNVLFDIFLDGVQITAQRQA